MKLLVRNNFIDLECPVYMSEKQKNKFIDGMKSIFNEKLVVQNIIENKKEMDKVEKHSKKFTEEDELILADSSLSNEEVAQLLGKSSFAVSMKRGPFLMELQEWAKLKGRTKITEKEVHEFLGSKK